MLQRLLKLLLYRRPLRAELFRRLVQKFNLLTYPRRIEYSAVERPHYGYCLYHAAQLAKKLGHRCVSAIEFGVAGGKGLINLEAHAAEVEMAVGIETELYGFDSGTGLPPPIDSRDLPYHWRGGFFAMNQELLRSKLKRSKLVLGDVASTLTSFAETCHPAPIGALYMDLDYHSSTVSAMKLFDQHRSLLLPRVFIYFDDIIGSEIELFSEFSGERLAISEFNAAHAEQKISPAFHLTAQPNAEKWHHQIYIYHDFQHPDYGKFISHADQQRNLNA